MSWQLTTFAGLALVLLGGFAWYERTRPSARLVALVAALAALAIAGRLVLAPIPNVVATTDIALITGYALGGAPGFAVGALAAPGSNLWPGQGLSARGVPFNVAHALGNVAIALAAGPALVRMISRYRTRLQFTWHPAGALPLALLALLVANTNSAGVL